MKSYRYRKLWEKAYGSIPKDIEGRSFEIHHIDGNRGNNKLDNLICLSIEDHYKLHLEQGDYGAANLIAERFNLEYVRGFKRPHSKQTIEKIKASKAANPYKPTQETLDKIRESRKNVDYSYLKGRKLYEESIAKREATRKANGNRVVLKCPHCGKEGINFMKKWHFDNCLVLTKGKQHSLTEEQKSKMRGPRAKKQCSHCGLVGSGSAMTRYHFDKCKYKP